MTKRLDYTVEDEVADVRMGKPHVVILGAGASRANCPYGDKNGKPLPLMIDFAACLGLSDLFRSWAIDPSQNFEDTYSALSESQDHEKIKKLNQLVESYFVELELPEYPTIYDYLILSLRDTDIIATFNWDPLLLQAYWRTPRSFKKPHLAFLHGNLQIGFCETDGVTGLVGAQCSRCGFPFLKTPILYPVGQKNYAANAAISRQWDLLRSGMKEAFMFTIFGYSGPKTDQEAIELMSEAWGGADSRVMEQAAFITLQSENEIDEVWSKFIHTHHYEIHRDFFESWIAKHPRRTGEAYLAQYLDARFVDNNPAPTGISLPELHRWFQHLLPAELMQNAGI